MKILHRLFPCPTGKCKDNPLGCRCGVIGTTAALITAGALAAAGGVAAGVGASQASKQASEDAEAQRDWNTQQYAAAKELEQVQLQEYKDITVPYNQDLQKLWQEYGLPQTTEQYKIFGEQVLPAEKELATQLGANLTQPLQLPQEVWDKIWQQTREKTLAEYAPIEQRTTQRLASTGGIGGGPGESLFKDIELSKAKSIESMAIEQAINEWTEKKAAKQQSYENIFKMLGYTPGTTTPTTSTSAVGTIQPYVNQPAQTSGVAEGIGSFVNSMSSILPMAFTGGASKAPTITGGVGGTNTGYQMTPYGSAPTWSPY